VDDTHLALGPNEPNPLVGESSVRQASIPSLANLGNGGSGPGELNFDVGAQGLQPIPEQNPVPVFESLSNKQHLSNV
jgi:hypothetical protein